MFRPLKNIYLVTLSLSKKNEDKQCCISPSPFMENMGNYMRIEMFILLTTEKRLLILTMKTPIARSTVPSTTGIMLYAFFCLYVYSYTFLVIQFSKKLYQIWKVAKCLFSAGKGRLVWKFQKNINLVNFPKLFWKDFSYIKSKFM